MAAGYEHETLLPSEEKPKETSIKIQSENPSEIILEHIDKKKKRSYGSIKRENSQSDFESLSSNGSSLAGKITSATYVWYEINVLAVSKSNSKKKIFKPSQSDIIINNFNQKQILNNVTGIARPGELLAIMGSSGAGKTTLLNTLTFRSSSNVVVSGARCVNGVPVTGNSLASISGYVQQEDLFIGTLTVREHLIFQARLRMDQNIPFNQRIQRVQEVISELALTKCQDTIIGIPGSLRGISGGEMKRLAFAAEVLTNPLLMFCDEPTSGLDSFMAQNVLQVLKKLAESGKTVVCTIHQPSSELYSMFDKLLLMAEGKVAFLGTPEEANEFFTQLGSPCPINYNPADHFIYLLAMAPGREEICRDSIDMICKCFKSSEIGQKIQIEAAECTKYQFDLDVCFQEVHKKHSPYKATWCQQFCAVLWRSWLSVIKNPMLIKVRFLQSILVAILVGLIFFRQEYDQDGVMNINGALFLFITNMTFQNVFAVINVFCTELPVFLREHKNGMYRTDVYFLCKTVAEAPIFILIPFIFTFVSYFMIGLNEQMPRVFVAAVIMALVANVATSFGYLISCISSSVSMALSIGPPVIIPFLLFGGFFLNAGSVPIYFKWLSYLSWFRYGNEALLINQWEGVDNIDCTRANFTCPKNGHIVLVTLNFDESDFLLDILCLVGLIVLFRLCAFLALLKKTYNGEN